MSEITNTATIKVVADASGVEAGLRPVDEAVAKTGKNLESLGATAKKTGQAIEDIGSGPGLNSVGDGAGAAATKVDKATKNMADSIQRATAAMDVGAKGTSAYYSALANQRGLNVAALRPYLDQLDAATKKTEQAAEAQRKLDDSSKFLEGLRARAEGIGKSASELAELRAAQLGVSESAAPMIARMRQAETGAGGMLAAFTPLRIAMLAIGAITAGGALFAHTIKDSIDAAAGMHDLSIETGASVAALMEFKRIGATSDTEVETIGGAMNKLAKGMAVSSEESKGLGQAIAAIGLSFTQLKALSPDQQMITVAKALDQFEDGASKSAVAMTFFGKEGAKLLPFLSDVAAESDNLTKSLTAQEIASKAAIAAMADNFGDNLTVIQQNSAAMRKEISYGMLPGLYEASQAYLDVTTQAGGLRDTIKKLVDDGSITAWTRTGITALTYLIDGFQYTARIVDGVAKGMGASLAITGVSLSGLAEAATLFAKGKFSQSLDAARSAASSVATIGKAFVSDLSASFGEDTFGAKLRARIGEIQKVGAAAGDAKKKLDYDGNDDGSAAAAKKEADVYAGLIASIRAKTDEDKLELATDAAATDGQKLRIKVDQELASGKLKLSAAHLAVVQAALAELDTTEGLVKAQQAEKDSMAWMQQSAQTRNASTAALQVEYDMYGKTADAREIAMVAIKAEADLEKFLTDERKKGVNFTDVQIAQLQAERDMRVEVEQATLGQTKALNYANQLAQENDKFGIQYIADDKARAAAQLELDSKVWKERIALAGEGTEAQKILQQNFDAWYQNQSVKPQLDEQKKMWSSIEQTAHDTFVSIFDSGKSAFDRLRDTLKNGLLDLLYQMTLKKWIISISSSVGLGGIGGLAQAATGTAGTPAASSGATSLVSAAQAASDIYKAITGGFTALSTGVADAVQAGLYSSGLSTQIASNGALATGVGTAAGALGGYAIGSTLNTAISGQYSIGSGLMTTEKIATAVASYFSPLAGAAVGAISGLFNRAFGMGSKEVTAQGVKGTLSTDSVTGSSYTSWHQDGGWFRSDKDGTDTTALTDAMKSQFTQGLQAIESASSGFAKSLGVSADWVSTYSKTFDIALTDDTAKNQQAITDFFNGVGDEIANKLVPNLASFTKTGETASATLERLAGDFKSTDQVAQLLGVSAATLFGGSGLGSATAREQLINIAGGLDALNTSAASFNQNFLTDAERLKPVAEALDTALGSLGLSTIPTTRAAFKDLVNSLIDSGAAATESGAKQLDALLALSAPFAQVHPDTTDTDAQKAAAVLQERQGLQDQLDQLTMTSTQLMAKQRDALDDSNKALFDQVQALTSQAAAIQAVKDSATTLLGNVDSAFSVLQKVVEREKATVQTSVDAHQAAVDLLQGLSDTIQSTLDSMRTSDQQLADRARAQAEIQADLTLTKAGGTLSSDQVGSLKAALGNVNQDASSQFSSYQDYLRDLYQTQSDIAQLGGVTDDSLSVEKSALKTAQDQLSALDAVITNAQAQIDILKGIDTNGLSLIQAIQGLGTSIQSAMTNPVVSSTSAINQAYQSSLGRAPDSAGLAYWQAQAASGVSIGDITKAISSSSEAAIQAMYQSSIGHAADGAGLQFWLTQLKNGTSLSDISRAIAGSSEAKLHPFAVGTNEVPDTMAALIHKGERIIPAADNRTLMARLASPSSNADVLAAAVDRLTEKAAKQQETIERQNELLLAIAGHTSGMASDWDDVINGRKPLVTEAALTD